LIGKSLPNPDSYRDLLRGAKKMKLKENKVTMKKITFNNQHQTSLHLPIGSVRWSPSPFGGEGGGFGLNFNLCF